MRKLDVHNLSEIQRSKLSTQAGKLEVLAYHGFDVKLPFTVSEQTWDTGDGRKSSRLIYQQPETTHEWIEHLARQNEELKLNAARRISALEGEIDQLKEAMALLAENQKDLTTLLKSPSAKGKKKETGGG